MNVVPKPAVIIDNHEIRWFIFRRREFVHCISIRSRRSPYSAIRSVVLSRCPGGIEGRPTFEYISSKTGCSSSRGRR